MERNSGRIDIINGKIVVDDEAAQLHRRLRREMQNNPMINRYWEEHNSKLKKQTEGKRRGKRLGS